MAITAKFDADFNDFNTEVVKAEKRLVDLEGSVVQVGAASSSAAPKAGALSASMKSMGLIAGSLGISLGGLTGGITSIATAAASAAAGLGAFATAGAVLAAGISGWGIGRKIAAEFNTDQIIGNATAKLLGWGDAAAGAAQNVADTLAKASASVGYQVNNMTDAVRILTDEHKKNQDAAKANAEAQKVFNTALEDVVIAGQNHAYVLRQMSAATLEGAKHALEHGAAVESVRKVYELTKPEMAAINDLLKKEAEDRKAAAKAATDQAEETAKAAAIVAAAVAEHGAAMGATIDQIFGTDALKAATNWVDVMNTAGVTINQLHSVELAELEEAMLAGIDALARSGNLTSQQSSAFADMAIQARAALDAMKPLVTTTDDLVKAQWDYVTALDEANAKAAEVPAATGPAKSSIDAIGASAQQAASSIFQMSAALYDSIRAAQNADAMNSLVPAWGITHPAPGAGIIRNVQPPVQNFNITHPLGTPDQIAKAVGSALTGSYSSGGNRLPV